jgi:hypothetical protein
VISDFLYYDTEAAESNTLGKYGLTEL